MSGEIKSAVLFNRALIDASDHEQGSGHHVSRVRGAEPYQFVSDVGGLTVSDIEPITVYHFEPDKFEVRTELVYPDSVLNEMARRVGDKLDEEILARLGYVKPVRCRDCRLCAKKGHRLYCDLNAGGFPEVDPDGYCAWGVRKEATK